MTLLALLGMAAIALVIYISTALDGRLYFLGKPTLDTATCSM